MRFRCALAAEFLIEHEAARRVSSPASQICRQCGADAQDERNAGAPEPEDKEFMHLVIVESPAKAKTINKYLGRDYEVVASFGHVRDLPAKDGSVDPERRFRHALGGRCQIRQAPRRHRQGGQSRRPHHSRDRPGSRGRGDFLACARSSEGEESYSRTSRSSASSSTRSPSPKCSRR